MFSLGRLFVLALILFVIFLVEYIFHVFSNQCAVIFNSKLKFST